ncbi:hypothetical protein BJ875DRAFT_69579 [Amylocarpus encephaloides]|uniref:Zn(2)-C6 fungal-type domain-containing protein n=1 Tax=Amylocarpus encephaloides TaxID=45428 RepID=A0A9P7YG08_9HELO|nr:hypothetical protein BJ875DRAFT_69579 [Amylocarpus encephaloides]
MASHQSSTLFYCTICSKPYAKESSYKRHVAYCIRTQNRPRVRMRSCRACSLAKSKCNFETPCLRCTTKGVDCIYERQAQRRAPKEASSPETSDSRESSNDGQAILCGGCPIFPTVDLNPGTGIASLDDWPTSNTDTDSSIFPPGGAILPTEDLGPHQFLPFDSTLTPSMKLDLLINGYDDEVTLTHFFNRCPERASECYAALNWFSMSRDEYLLSQGITPPHPSQLNQNALAVRPMSDPLAQHNAALILQAIRSFPRMMTRRRSFPPFVHPHWNEVPLGKDKVENKSLLNCMNIAKSFSSMTYEGKKNLWDLIRSEEYRFVEQINDVGPKELLYSIQAMCIYILIRFLDHHQDNKNALQMLLSFQVLCTKFRTLVAEPFSTHELTNPSGTWNDWIFAESRRRMCILWFLMDRVVSVTTGIACDTTAGYRDLPLPSHRSLWEAQSQEAWQSEYIAVYNNSSPSPNRFGDLIDAHKHQDNPGSMQLLDSWNTGIDGIGYMLNLAIAMVD